MNDYVLKKYKQFYDKHGYIPPIFNPYNCTEIKDIAPCITSNCGNECSSAAVLIIESEMEGIKCEYRNN